MVSRSDGAGPIAFAPIDPMVDLCIGCHRQLTPEVQSDRRFFCLNCSERLHVSFDIPPGRAPHQFLREQTETVVAIVADYVEALDQDLARADLDPMDRELIEHRRIRVACILDHLAANWRTAKDSDLQLAEVSTWRRA